MQREKKARGIIGEWLVGLVLVRRAQALRRTLDAERKQSEAYRREMAARRIQPVWRGAALRRRLRRLLHPADEDDDEDYEKVELRFEQLEDNADPIGALLKKAMHVAAPAPLSNFDVPVAFPQAAPAPSTTNTYSFDVTSEDLAARPDSAPFPTKKEKKRATTLSKDASRPTSSAQSVNAVPSAAEQWGVGVYAQLQKKKKKMNNVHNQHIMQGFQADPLYAKRLREGKH
ncbi:hypothetical protein STCU_11848 [Strigomonas culicis]|uniref:Uncharacterized protein n=1 Tax=Strigomonas culicis TaxID=28005 RepID=S9ULW6_9TRYP|nr:hypothetical protein STCU_11848 [Strigomonas culicis]|eukprot:EPY15666.1 hypothetical protein STCU_11848 [Strigomonas culicis]